MKGTAKPRLESIAQINNFTQLTIFDHELQSCVRYVNFAHYIICLFSVISISLLKILFIMYIFIEIIFITRNNIVIVIFVI